MPRRRKAAGSGGNEIHLRRPRRRVQHRLCPRAEAHVASVPQEVFAGTDLDEAVDIANDTEYGLSAVVSGDPAKAAAVAPKLRAGMVAVNAWGPAPGAAFGGYKASGNGREGGLFGLKDFMEVKSISGIPA